MEYRNIGRSDLKVSTIGLGGNVFGAPRLDLESSRANILRARDLGINFIDTAYLYNDGQSEQFVGEVLKGIRNDFIVATKFHFFGLETGESPEQRIRDHCDTSLQRLQTDHIDLMQIHFPADEVPPEVVMGTLNQLIAAGKIRFIGQCNYASWRHLQADNAAQLNGWAPFVSAQNQFSLLRRQVEAELLPFCQQFDVGFLPYFPLAGGFLSGKYRPGEPPPPGSRGAANSPVIRGKRTERNEAILASLSAYAGDHGHSVLELAFAWLLAHPQVSSVIAGTMSVSQVEQNAAAGSWSLTTEQKLEVDQLAAWDGSDELVEPSLSSFK
ncbi:MAG: aldo/keto reductase [Immundisolibacteraceae bacterium]|nr:aldo/keto reductase [Immundisolibacteraceae bacterium]